MVVGAPLALGFGSAQAADAAPVAAAHAGDAAVPPHSASAKRPARSDPAAIVDPHTPEGVRTLLLTGFRYVADLQRQLLDPYTDGPKTIIGRCYGQPAYGVAKLSEVVPTLERSMTGPALRCFVASYFGCTVGDRFAEAGSVFSDYAGQEPFAQSKVTFIENTPDRVVADVVEQDGEDRFDTGVLGKPGARGHRASPAEIADANARAEYHSRYTFVREATGGWKIYDRKPNNPWECRPN